jgi:hypothetical protein
VENLNSLFVATIMFIITTPNKNKELKEIKSKQI